MKLTPEIWHRRYLDQARWTQPARRYLFGLSGDLAGKKILDVGCGTGAILQEFENNAGSELYGIDISFENIKTAQKHTPGVSLQQADAQHLPFGRSVFDLTYTHYVVLWLPDPLSALSEMRRVTRPGGAVLALAEPDYGGRIDNPPELSMIGAWQIDSLKHQGANPFIGRRLGELFLAVGLVNVQSGIMGGEWRHEPKDLDSSEWDIINNDIQALSEAPFESEVERLKSLDAQAQENGSRILFVPTFYAIGHVPG